MKKDRNCGMSMPIYPNYMPNMMPGVPQMNMYGLDYSNFGYSNSTVQASSIEQQLSSLNSQIDSLERRVNNLESLIGNNSSTYNTTNYQML